MLSIIRSNTDYQRLSEYTQNKIQMMILGHALTDYFFLMINGEKLVNNFDLEHINIIKSHNSICSTALYFSLHSEITALQLMQSNPSNSITRLLNVTSGEVSHSFTVFGKQTVLSSVQVLAIASSGTYLNTTVVCSQHF